MASQKLLESLKHNKLFIGVICNKFLSNKINNYLPKTTYAIEKIVTIALKR